MERVLFVRGNKAPPWEAPVLEHLAELGYSAKFVVSSLNENIPLDLQIEGKNLNSNPALHRLFNKSLPARFLNYGLNIKTVEFTSKYFGDNRLFKKTDIMHLVDDIFSPGIQASRASEKVVITVWENIPYHSGIENGFPTKKYRKEVFSNVKKFLPVTQESKKYLIAAGVPEELVEVIHPGINPNDFKINSKDSEVAQKLRVTGKHIILGVARIEYFKGITFVLRALKELLGVRKDFLYVHVGKGSEKFERYLREMINVLGLKENVLFLGNVSYSDIPQIYHACDIFVLPSIPTLLWEEQLGFSLLEAMAAGKPVIASDLPAIKEVVGNESGLFFSTGNYLQLTERLLQLIDESELRRTMGTKGRKHVESEFNARTTATKYADIYKELVE